jgi:DNA-binding response OmpR family regulator
LSSCPSPSPARILIVDDERLNRQLLEVMLAPQGYVLMTAACGDEAMAIIRTQPPDLILLDIMMPRMDGYQVTAAIKRTAATQHIPIIIITALDDHDSLVRGLQAGAEEFLTKPIDCDELYMRVRNLLRLKACVDFYRDYSEMLEAEVVSRTAALVEQVRGLEDELRKCERATYAAADLI